MLRPPASRAQGSDVQGVYIKFSEKFKGSSWNWIYMTSAMLLELVPGYMGFETTMNANVFNKQQLIMRKEYVIKTSSWFHLFLLPVFWLSDSMDKSKGLFEDMIKKILIDVDAKVY